MIFTIGHSDHRIERFLVLLARNHIDAVADVRSSAFSRLNPQFSRDALANSLGAAGIHYVEMGKELGARRTESACYVKGQAQYSLIANLPLFQEGLDRLRLGALRLRIAIMCAEKDPLTCHRSILVCRHLRLFDLPLAHILYDGQIERHESLEDRLVRAFGIDGQDLLMSHQEAVERAYDLQADRIAYVKSVKPIEQRV